MGIHRYPYSRILRRNYRTSCSSGYTRFISSKGSSLALDIYCWLTYPMSYLRKPIEIPWTLLAAQFGSDYTELRDFKKNFLKQLRKVDVIYNTNIQQGQKGLLIKPGKTHILSSRQA